MPRFGSFYGPLFLLVLETVGFDLPGDPHAQSKPGDEGCQGCLLPQLDLQILRTEQQLIEAESGPQRPGLYSRAGG